MEKSPLGMEFKTFRSWCFGGEDLPGVEWERLVVAVRELVEWFKWLRPLELLWGVDAGLPLEPRQETLQCFRVRFSRATTGGRRG